MANGHNLFVSYDLHEPGKNYEKVAEAIKALGSWAKVHFSYWYVDSTHTAKQAAEAVWRVMDANDSVFVADTKSNDAAWYNLKPEVQKHVKEHWNQ